MVESLLPRERLANRVGARPRQDRHGEKAGADQPERQQQGSGVAGQRLQRSAASAAVCTSVRPARPSVAADARMMKYIIALEKSIPMFTSQAA